MGAVKNLKVLLANRQAEFERREYVWAEWRRKDIEEREKTKEILDAVLALDEAADETSAPTSPGAQALNTAAPQLPLLPQSAAGSVPPSRKR